MQRPVRLPLQVGTSALWSYVRFASTLVPGGLVIAAAVLMVVPLVAHLDESGIALLVGTVVIGLGLMFFSLKHLWLSFRLRPSDVVITPAGLQMEGGRHRGEPIPWQEIDAAGCHIEEHEATRPTLAWILVTGLMLMLAIITRSMPKLNMSKVTVWHLHLAHRRHGVSIAAEAESELERESLEALLESIRAMCAPKPTTPPPHAPNVLACRGCGAPAPAADAPTIECRYCGTAIAIPDDLRTRIRAASQIEASQAKTQRHVAQLLNQPGATPTNMLFLLGALPMAIAWPLVCVVAFYQWRQDAIGLATTLPLFVFPLAVIAGTFVLLRFRLVNRQALRLLTLGFAARDPVRPGDPYTCRRCGGALPAQANANALVAQCLFCNAENVLGIDLRGQEGAHVEEATSLEQALATRNRQRAFWGLLLPVAVGLLALGGIALWRGFVPPDTIAGQYRGFCDDGNAGYCDALATMYETGAGVTADEERAAEIWSKSCTLGSARACHAIANYYRTGRGGIVPDLARAVQLDAWACQAGNPEACYNAPR
jgi:hypothetical protein